MALVLIVDDEFGLAKLLGQILADQGHRALIATNGRQALERAMNDPPDLVLTDFMMPIMDGAGLMRALGDSPKLAAVPVILMSSLPEDSVAPRCPGYVAFIRKPFNLNELIEVVAKFSPDTP